MLVNVVLLDIRYQEEFQDLSDSSPLAMDLSSISSQLETRLYQFGLSGIFQVTTVSLSNWLVVDLYSSPLGFPVVGIIPGVSVHDFVNYVMYCIFHSSGVVQVSLKVSNYLPRDSSPLLRPSVGAVAGALQVVLESGRVGAHRINASTPSAPSGEEVKDQWGKLHTKLFSSC